MWTSHEALLTDYELPMVRDLGPGRRRLGSTRFPWVGERTRRLDGAHVALLAEVGNPIGCKVGPSRIDEPGSCSTTLCDPRLNPEQAAAMVSVWAEPLARRAETPLLIH